MKKYIAMLPLLLIIACDNTGSTSDSKDAETGKPEEPKTETYCYLKTEGTEDQDTFIVKLVIDGNTVTGEMKYLPWQKDASVGSLKGTKEGDKLQLNWTYWQEGMETTEVVGFKLEGDKIHQQVAAFTDQGEMYLPDNAEYSDVFSLVDCDVFPERDY